MESLNISATDQTPKVLLDAITGVFEIEGKAISNDADAFFKPILNWLSDYSKNPKQETNVTIKLDYFNISSSKRILFIFYKLNEIVENGNQVNIKWFYHEDEDDMFEVGKDFAYMVKIPFEFIEYSYFEKEVV